MQNRQNEKEKQKEKSKEQMPAARDQRAKKEGHAMRVKKIQKHKAEQK